MTSRGAILGGAAGPPFGAPGTAGSALSAMAALPLGAQHDRRPRAGDASDPVQRTDGGLQCRDVGHADLQHVALAAGDPPAVLHLGQRGQSALDAGVVDRVALDHAHQRGDAQAPRRRVDHRPVAGDDARGLQLPAPLVPRGRGEADPPRQLGVARPSVGAQQVDQLPVDGVDGVLLLPGSHVCAVEYRPRTYCGGGSGSNDEGGGPPWRSWWCSWWRSPWWFWCCVRRRRVVRDGCARLDRRAGSAPSARSRRTTTPSSCVSWSAAPGATTALRRDSPVSLRRHGAPTASSRVPPRACEGWGGRGPLSGGAEEATPPAAPLRLLGGRSGDHGLLGHPAGPAQALVRRRVARPAEAAPAALRT